MLAEEEADKAIATAKEEVAAAREAAEADRRTRIAATEMQLKEAEQAEWAKHERRVADVVNKIKAEADAQVAAIAQRFVTRKAELLSLLKERLDK